jgi:hypothetical protein
MKPKSKARAATTSAIFFLLGLPFEWQKFRHSTDTPDLVVRVSICLIAAVLFGVTLENAWPFLISKIGQRHSMPTPRNGGTQT